MKNIPSFEIRPVLRRQGPLFVLHGLSITASYYVKGKKHYGESCVRWPKQKMIIHITKKKEKLLGIFA